MAASVHSLIDTAYAARSRGDCWAAAEALRQALDGSERAGEGWRRGVLLAREIGDDFAAMEMGRRYLRDVGPTPETAHFVAEAMTDAGAADEAVALLAPHESNLTPNARFKFTRMLMFAGRIGEAQERARALLADNPNSPTLWERVAQTKRFAAGDPDIDAMRGVFDRWPLSRPAGRVAIAAALAKAFVDIGDDAAADLHLCARSEAFRALFPFNPEGHRAALTDIVRWCESGAVDGAATTEGSGRATFILGPNRSGTTLVEQIFARHPEVGAGGERRWFWLASKALGDCGASAIAKYLDGERTRAPASDPWAPIGRRYLGLADEFARGARFTDKLLSNVYRVRAIRQALPDAKIVYVKRNPLAVAWSCWRSQFDGESAWGGSPEGIALYIATYRRAMEAWISRYPGAITCVNYEDLVRFPDAEIPRVLGECGLRDHPATRAPHLSERAVATLSFAQIREPLQERGVVAGFEAYPQSVRSLREALDAIGLEV